MKILLACWAPFRAGAEVAAERLAVGLRENEHDVTIIVGTNGDTLDHLRGLGFDVRHVPLAFTDKLRWWRYFRAQRAMRAILSEVRPEIVHANDLPTSQMVAEVAGQLGIPRVCHHRWIFEGPAIEWLNKFGAERHLFVSSALMNTLCSASRRLAGSPRSVVYDGLPLPPLSDGGDRLRARQSLGLPCDKTIVLFAGQIVERKGVEDLLRAWQLLEVPWSQRAALVIVGDDLKNQGAYRRQMESLAREINCPAKFVGFQTNVSQWLTAANCCVVPSHAEPLGNATLEAMAQGLPVIGANVGGIPEMIVAGETGLLVPPKNPAQLAVAIELLIKDEGLRLRLGRSGRARCEERFSLWAHTQAVVDEYRRALAPQAVKIG
jgi:glycosyltransferase involved in cell wall biosynthesis